MSFVNDKRIIIYPNYINSKKTVAEGRRIPLPKACENPNVGEMADCIKYLKLSFEIEDKSYPRDWMVRGRIRVELKNEDGTLANPEIPTRRELLLRIAELVPRHPSRKKMPAKVEASSSAAASGSKAGGSAKSNKKKKK